MLGKGISGPLLIHNHGSLPPLNLLHPCQTTNNQCGQDANLAVPASALSVGQPFKLPVINHLACPAANSSSPEGIFEPSVTV